MQDYTYKGEAMINQERLINRFLEYVQIDSPTLSEADFKETVIQDVNEFLK